MALQLIRKRMALIPHLSIRSLKMLGVNCLQVSIRAILERSADLMARTLSRSNRIFLRILDILVGEPNKQFGRTARAIGGFQLPTGFIDFRIRHGSKIWRR